MILALTVIALSVIPVMLVGKVIAMNLTSWRWGVLIAQTAVATVLAYIAFYTFTFFALYAALAMTLYPLAINVSSLIYKRNQRGRALGGHYGDEVQWAAEIAESGDQQFAIAVNELPERELMEIGIIAESKQELRDLTVERFEELADNEIPEDFA